METSTLEDFDANLRYQIFDEDVDLNVYIHFGCVDEILTELHRQVTEELLRRKSIPQKVRRSSAW